MRWVVCRLIAAFLFAAVATGAWAAPGKRVALVIGNGAYQFTAPLSNPANDAADMAAALKRLGFEVIEGRNLDESGLRRTIKRFAEALTGADVGLFFYAGHGLQVAGHNYLVPVDARLENAAGLDFELIRLDIVHRTMERETKTNVIFLDACRDNPLSRNLARSMGTRSSQIGKGLAVVESGVGTLISFSTQPGNVALDGEGRNSPYAASLIKHIGDPKEDLSTLLIQVRNEVMAATRDQQIPWEHSALRSKFYFVGLPPPPPAPVAKPAVPPPASYGAELAAQAEELRRAVEEARLAREAAKSAEERRVAALKAAEEARARARMASVPPATEVLTAEASALARQLQTELRRVGCDPGDADGTWGPKARGALQQFASATKLSLAIDTPTEAALNALKEKSGRVCALTCGPGEREGGGKCVAKRPVASKPQVAEQPPRPAPVGRDPCEGKGWVCHSIRSGKSKQ
jgi:uncharacterized caspase-like protein